MSNDIHAVHLWVSMVITLVLVGVGLVYMLGWLSLRRDSPKVIGVHRLAEFLVGLFVLWVAVASPLATLDHQLLSAHMAQHLLLMTVAAPLILLSAPIIALLHGLPHVAAHRVLGLFGNSELQKLVRILTHPVLCWVIGTGTVVAWHVPALFEAGMHSESWHTLQYACFFASGLLFWWPLIVPWPSVVRWSEWSAPLYLFLATLPCDALSAFLTFCNRLVYPHYRSIHSVVSPLEDQANAGALMWVWVTFAYLAPAAVITIRILSPGQRSSQVADSMGRMRGRFIGL